MGRSTRIGEGLLLGVLACAGRSWAVTSGVYSCEVTIAEDTCGNAPQIAAREVELSGGGSETFSLLAPSALTLQSAAAWASVQFGAQDDPNAYTSSGGFRCNGAWVSFMQRAELSSVGTSRVAMRLSYEYGGEVSACGGAPGCRRRFEMVCTRLR